MNTRSAIAGLVTAGFCGLAFVAAAEAPRFNYPRIFGVRPGSPVVFRLPVSGTRPMAFAAEGLPAGVKLDAATGVLSGASEARGTNRVVFTARNAEGSCRQEFRLVVGDEIALTPPMGFNTFGGWGAYERMTEKNVRSSIKALVDKGLVDHGYSYCNLDDGWQGTRGGKYFAMQFNGKFGDPKKLGDDIHALGLKFGLYSTPRLISYAGYFGGSSEYADGHVTQGEFKPAQVGRYVYDANDARQIAEWGCDYWKYDWNMRTNAWGVTPEYMYESIALAERMSVALKAQNRDIVLELSHSVPHDRPERFTAAGNMTRADADLMDVWFKTQLPKNSGVGIRDLWKVHRNERFRRQSRPGHWNMPCPLRVGMLGGWEGDDRPLYKARLTPEEQFSHLSLWYLWSAPVIIGAPVDLLDEFTMNLLTNDEMLALNQDPLGIQAYDYEVEGGEVLVKPLEDGDVAVGLFNPEKDEPSQVTVTWKLAGVKGPQSIRDLWKHADLGVFDGSFTATVPRHGVVVVRLHSAR